MIQNRTLKKTVAYALIAAMLNPAAILPAYALDTDIFLNPPTGLAFGEPNIMIVLDTSDSMWIPEPWHEVGESELVNPANVDDPVNYDSHYEYLWNDTAFIHSIGCNIASCATAADRYTNAASPNGRNLARFNDYDVRMNSMPQGYFEGADAATRGALKLTAVTNAATTVPGDPGPRSTFRNYGGGTTSTVAASQTYDSSWVYWLPAGTPETDLRLMSTSPSRAPLGSRVSRFSNSNGLSTNPVVRGGIHYGDGFDHAFNNFNLTTLTYQQGTAGANRCATSYANLLPSTVFAPGPYAKNTGKFLGQQWVRYERFLGLDSTRVANFPTSAAGDAARAQWVVAPFFNGNINTSPNRLGTAPAVTQMIDDFFVPIRTQGGSAFAGWTDLRTDMGGNDYRLWSQVPGDSGANNTILRATLAAFGITTNAIQARVRAQVKTFETGAHASSLAGCTDAASCARVGVSLGIPAYLDVAATVTDPSVAPTVCAFSPSDGRLNAGPDAKNNAAFLFRSGAPGTATNPNCVKTSGPGTCVLGGGIQFSRNDNRDARWVGRSTLVSEGTTYFHGGTCQARCSYGRNHIGQCAVAPSASPGPAFASPFVSAPTYSIKGVVTPPIQYFPSLVVGGVTLFDVITGGTADAQTACIEKADLGLVACNVNTPGCVDPEYNMTCSPLDPPGSTLPVFTQQLNDPALVHDCLADNGVPDFNPSGSHVIANNRTFNTAYNLTVSTGAASPTASYTNSSGLAPAADPTKKVDMYAVNYLNFKYGPRGPNLRPIARKTRMQIAKDALAGLVASTNGVRYGLMTFNGLPADLTKRNSEGSQGARVVFPITDMGSRLPEATPQDLSDANNRDTLITRIFAQEARGATPLTESIFEAMLYFSGRAPRFGTNAAINANFGATSLVAQGGGNVADGADATAVCTSSAAGCPLGAAPGNPLYKSPMLNNLDTTTPAACQRNFIVLITDGGPDRDKDANTQIQNTRFADAPGAIFSARTTVDTQHTDTPLTDQLETSPGVPFGPQSTTDISLPGGSNGFVWLDELASFMNRADMSPGAQIFVGDSGADSITQKQSVKLFTIGFAGVTSAVLQNAATGSFRTAQNSAELIAALQDAVTNVTNSNATIASPTVPLASNRGENATDVYIPFFKPTSNSAWDGTLKKYKLGLEFLNPGICGVDGAGNVIQACLTGQTDLCGPGCKNIEQFIPDPFPATTFSVVINPNAVSIWSSPGTPDGGQPDKGGSGHMLISTAVTPATRKVYTHLSAQTNHVLTDVTNQVDEANATITKTLLGNAGMTDAERSTLINFIRGGNTGDANCADALPATLCTAWRPWAHAAVQHTSPVVVTYSSTSQFVFYLSVDGLLHAVDSITGEEKWSLLVEEAFPRLNALMTNDPGAPIQVADGSISFFHQDFNRDGIVNTIGGTDKVFMFFGLRRGGRAYYALDITDINTPVFKWKITNTQICSPSCTPSITYARLGQTWSTPIVARLQETSVIASGLPALVFSGGYDPNQDITPNPAVGSDTMGQALFVVKMTDGSLVKEFFNGNVTGGMLSAIPSDPAVLNTTLDSQGFIDRIYVGDVAANMYRFDVDNPNKALWTGKKLAALSDTSPPNRKILFPPVVVKQSVPLDFDAVYIGTGDREHPLVTTSTDKIFMIMDRDIGVTSDQDPTLVANFPTGFLSIPTAAGIDPNALLPLTVKGWFRDLDPGEKVTGSPTVLADKLRFPSYTPTSTNVCAVGGEGRLNELNATTGAFTLVAGTARFGPTSTGLMSGTFQLLIGGKEVTVTFGIAGPEAGGQTATNVQGSAANVAGQGRVYWYIEPEL